MRWLRRVSALAAGGLLTGLLAQAPALAAPASSAHPAAAAGHSVASAGRAASPGGSKPAPARLPDPGKVLPSGWQHSADEAVTVSGDAAGLHVLAASESSGYAWRTVATLGDPSVATDLWIGQACVTAAGRYAVVVYAPEQADNMAQQQGVLGRAAVVNLRTGAVRDLGGGFSIAYFDPGCGTGNQAVLTAGGWANDTSNAAMTTNLVMVNAATGKLSAPVKVAGQVTSAVPYGGQIAAAGGRGVEEISASGTTRLLVATAAVPFRLTPAADGSLGYQVMAGNAYRLTAGKKVGLWRLAGGRSRMVATAAAGSVELSQVGGRTWLVGPQTSRLAGLPARWRPVDAPVTAQPSTLGTVAVTSASAAGPVKGRHYDPAGVQPAVIGVKLLAGKLGTASFTVPTTAAPPAAGAAARARRAGVAPAYTTPAGSPSTPVSDDRTCAIAIDDPNIQAYQPDFKQVEWAADQAVQGTLTDPRSAGLYGSPLPAYTVQGTNGLFPGTPTTTLGRQIPVQVLLGVLTQESNLQQASQHVIQGQTSNPLTSFNWYGNWTDGETNNTGLINWSNSDCGYGIGQITTGMCIAPGANNDDQCNSVTTNPMSPTQQLAIAVDYQANIAKAADLLAYYWNTLYADGIYPDGQLPGLENDPFSEDYVNQWYMAIWAYNSGIEPGSPAYGNSGCQPGWSCTDNGGTGGNWGLGYADNPINPIYPPDRPNFPSTSSNTTPTGTTYSPDWDMSHPQYWPYQEKVIGWAFDSITLWDYSLGEDVQAFAYAHGNTTVPAFATFCVPGPGTDPNTPGDNCDASNVDYTSGSTTGPDSCQLQTDPTKDHCWWHYPAAWAGAGTTASCILDANCGFGQITYLPGTSEPTTEPIAAQFAQTCESTLPSTAVIVGDGGKSALGCPGQDWTSQGSFTWNFAPDSNGYYSSKMAFDQIGAGFGGHFWFGYSQPEDTPTDTVITGTWSPPSSVSGWTDVKVAIPSYGANADGAMYQVNPGGGQPGKNVLVDQGATSGTNTWVDLGTFHLGSGATVTLSNVTPNTVTIGIGVSGSDLAWSAAAFIPVSGPPWVYTAMGDSYSSGEGNPPYDVGTAGGCDRSNAAFGRQFAQAQSSIGTTGIQHIACSGATINNLTTTGQNGEQPQISQMTPGSQLVTVTIGGNDIGFAGVLTDCLANPTTTCITKYNSDDDNNLYAAIDNLKPNLIAAYQAMQAAAPNAKIVAVTYPLIFQPGTTCAGILNLPVPDVDFLNDVGSYLDDTIMDAAQTAGIDSMDERYAFLGHALCSADPWVYQLPTSFTAGTAVLDSSAWFHPNAEGQAQIASDLGAYWQAPQSVQTDTPKSAALKDKVKDAAATGWVPLHLPQGIPTAAKAQWMLSQLPRTSTVLSGYNSDANYWNFTTVDGCDTRQDVLREEAVSPAEWTGALSLIPSASSSPLCPITQGSWQTPYDAAETPLNLATQDDITNNIDIDHIVPKANAWETGAANWPGIYGTALGNALLSAFSNARGVPELLAVSSTSNGQKGDSSPELWMPINTGMTCPYVEAWIAVKYAFTIDVSTIVDAPSNPIGTSELTFLQNTLSSC
jgi:lysophospholipase L1-like esterase